MHCTNCGHELNNNESFCSVCGTPVNSMSNQFNYNQANGMQTSINNYMQNPNGQVVGNSYGSQPTVNNYVPNQGVQQVNTNYGGYTGEYVPQQNNQSLSFTSQYGNSIPNNINTVVNPTISPAVNTSTPVENNTSKSFSLKYLFILLVLVIIIGCLSFIAFGSNSNNKLDNTTTTVSPEIEVEIKTTTTSKKTTSKIATTTTTSNINDTYSLSDNTFSSGGYIFTLPNGFSFYESAGQKYIINSDRKMLFLYETEDVIYDNFIYNVNTFIEELKTRLSATNIQYNSGKSDNIQYIYFTFDQGSNKFVFTIVKIDSNLVLLTTGLLGSTGSPSAQDYIDVTLEMAKNVKVSTTDFSPKDSVQDLFEDLKDFISNNVKEE